MSKKKKTPEEWFQELPDGYRELAIANIKENNKHYKPHPESLMDAILDSFEWPLKEASFFWNKVYKHYMSNGRLKLPQLPDEELKLQWYIKLEQKLNKIVNREVTIVDYVIEIQEKMDELIKLRTKQS